jgi:hypothetical protein
MVMQTATLLGRKSFRACFLLLLSFVLVFQSCKKTVEQQENRKLAAKKKTSITTASSTAFLFQWM